MDIPILEKKDPNAIPIEVAALFKVTLIAVNSTGEVRTLDFSMPPGLYPNPAWTVELVKETQRESLRALKLQTQDLSWRLPSPTEFVRITSGNPLLTAQRDYKEPYTVQMDTENNDNDSN